MKKRKTTMITFLMIPMICLSLVGCGGVKGTWYHVESDDEIETLTLKGDQSFITDSAIGSSGQWEEVDDNIILSTTFGSTTLLITEKDGKDVLNYEDDFFYRDKGVALEAYEKEKAKEIKESKKAEKASLEAEKKLEQECKNKVKEMEAEITKKLVGTWKAKDGTMFAGGLHDPDKFLVEFKKNGTYKIISSDFSNSSCLKGETGTFKFSDASTFDDPGVYLRVKSDGEGAETLHYSNSEEFDTKDFSLWLIDLKKID